MRQGLRREHTAEGVELQPMSTGMSSEDAPITTSIVDYLEQGEGDKASKLISAVLRNPRLEEYIPLIISTIVKKLNNNIDPRLLLRIAQLDSRISIIDISDIDIHSRAGEISFGERLLKKGGEEEVTDYPVYESEALNNWQTYVRQGENRHNVYKILMAKKIYEVLTQGGSIEELKKTHASSLRFCLDINLSRGVNIISNVFKQFWKETEKHPATAGVFAQGTISTYAKHRGLRP